MAFHFSVFPFLQKGRLEAPGHRQQSLRRKDVSIHFPDDLHEEHDDVYRLSAERTATGVAALLRKMSPTTVRAQFGRSFRNLRGYLQGTNVS